MRLEASVPSNNWKIVEIYNKIKSKTLLPSSSFQRKLVWKKNHKFKFIETILENYPFPEIYIAPGELNVSDLTLVDVIVDGQQRATTIVNYIQGTDVFATPEFSKPFAGLSDPDKMAFLNYEVSVRYLKNVSSEQIIDIFKRINNTEYSLNKIERLHAEWGESEFMLFCKQMFEFETVANEIATYKFPLASIEKWQHFLHDEAGTFTDIDDSRMFTLQFGLVLVSTIIKAEYFQRNENIQDYIERFNEEFPIADEVRLGLERVIDFIGEIFPAALPEFWQLKSNIFTLLIELYKVDTQQIDKSAFRDKMIEIDQESTKLKAGEEINPETMAYIQNCRQAVNEKWNRQARAEFFVKKLLAP